MAGEELWLFFLFIIVCSGDVSNDRNRMMLRGMSGGAYTLHPTLTTEDIA